MEKELEMSEECEMEKVKRIEFGTDNVRTNSMERKKGIWATGIVYARLRSTFET